jgi:Ni/Co efflux regulator RcnB
MNSLAFIHRGGGSTMRKIAVTAALAALALWAVPAANAAPAQSQKPITTSADEHQAGTDMSSHRRHWRRHRHVRYYPRYYRSYGYYPRPYYYNPAPVVSFGFGFGGPRFYGGHRHWRNW